MTVPTVVDMNVSMTVGARTSMINDEPSGANRSASGASAEGGGGRHKLDR